MDRKQDRLKSLDRRCVDQVLDCLKSLDRRCVDRKQDRLKSLDRRCVDQVLDRLSWPVLPGADVKVLTGHALNMDLRKVRPGLDRQPGNLIAKVPLGIRVHFLAWLPSNTGWDRQVTYWQINMVLRRSIGNFNTVLPGSLMVKGRNVPDSI